MCTSLRPMHAACAARSDSRNFPRSVPQGPAWATRTPKAGDQVRVCCKPCSHSFSRGRPWPALASIWSLALFFVLEESCRCSLLPVPLCCLPGWVLLLFCQVAAKVEDEALWILATVEKHNEKKGFFVVVDDDAGDGKRRWVDVCVCVCVS